MSALVLWLNKIRTTTWNTSEIHSLINFTYFIYIWSKDTYIQTMKLTCSSKFNQKMIFKYFELNRMEWVQNLFIAIQVANVVALVNSCTLGCYGAHSLYPKEIRVWESRRCTVWTRLFYTMTEWRHKVLNISRSVWTCSN